VKACFASLVLLCGLRLWGQFAALPQADSPEEFDAYLAVLEAHTPSAVIAAGDAFSRAWPASGLRGHVYELEFETYRALGDAPNAITAGEKSLAAVPDNLMVLANLSVVLANGTSDAKRLARAEEYARKVIALSKTFRLPRSITPQEWAQTDGRLQSQAHAALGLVANQRGEIKEAIREFEAAVALAPAPDATQIYRLGILYRAAGKVAAAREKFQQAAESGEPAIRELARNALRRLETH
jgi:tetratricopeptide (TPR) repeat protein